MPGAHEKHFAEPVPRSDEAGIFANTLGDDDRKRRKFYHFWHPFRINT